MAGEVTPTFDCRVAFAETMLELAAADPRVVVVVADTVGSSNLGSFRDAYPDRLINVGIAEQDLIGVAAGLAGAGLKPFVSAAGCFLTARAMEQIKVDLAYSGRAVTLCAQSPGFSYGALGSTHHSAEDLGWLRTIPELTVLAPVDPVDTAGALRWAASHDGPVYVRIGRVKVPQVNPADLAFRPGQAVQLADGAHVTLVATGAMAGAALEARDLLAGAGVEARVLAMASVKPLDRDAIGQAAAETGAIVTVEDALVTGLGGAVAELLAVTRPTPMRMVGIQDQFAPVGDPAYLFEYFGLTPVAIRDAALELVG
ncbi:MAG: hypothetical protein LBR27_05150 [Bifidobacteriaceae bacterium]|jgi:transketolase|nr:hypothetical protein [Bifidobacteriaceae bacterium]